MGPPKQSDRLAGMVAAVGAFVFLTFGLWAMVAPQSFFESIALFEPYNEHFIQDIGSFQIGLGAVLAMAAFFTSDALVAGLVGVGIGALAHVISHLLGLDAGGRPALDLPSLAILGAALLIVGVVRWRRSD